MAVLNRILANAGPHPTGSTANDEVRNNIAGELKRLGYSPEIQTAFSCDGYGTCGTVHNIVARLTGTEEASEAKPAVLLSAHYDSVPAGPGASDDGTGVAAAVEIARALRSLAAPRNSVLLVIDDGEEAGLLGARAFVESGPWARSVRAAVNMDARGTMRPSLMFETGSADLWAVRLYAEHAARPATSSIFYTAYKELPNDTDFTVFKAAGYQGLNFAYIGGVSRYHTPIDNTVNVDRASLQHQGENAFASVFALANADLTRPPPGEAVFFDLLERWTVRWPASSAVKLAIVTDLLLLGQIAWLFWAERVKLAELKWGISAWLFVIAATGILGYAMEVLIRLTGAIPVNWIAQPVPIEIAFWMLAISVVSLSSRFFVERAGFWGLWCGVWIWWATLSFFIAWLANGVSYVLLPPSAAAALSVVGFTATRREKVSQASATLATILPAAIAWITGIVPAILLYDGLGTRALPFIGVVVALLVTPLAPLCNDLRGIGFKGFAFSWVPVAAMALAVFASVVAPPYSVKAPERTNMDYWEDADSGASQWVVHPESGRLADPIRVAATFHSVDHGPFPWEHGTAFLSAAPALKLAAPTFTILDLSQGSGKQQYRALLRSERGAPEAMVLFPPDAEVQSVRINGQAVQPLSRQVLAFLGGWKVFRCVTMPAEGIEMAFSLGSGKPIQVEVVDATFNLPEEGKFLLNARPLTAVPSQDGDVTIVSRQVQLLP